MLWEQMEKCMGAMVLVCQMAQEYADSTTHEEPDSTAFLIKPMVQQRAALGYKQQTMTKNLA